MIKHSSWLKFQEMLTNDANDACVSVEYLLLYQSNMINILFFNLWTEICIMYEHLCHFINQCLNPCHLSNSQCTYCILIYLVFYYYIANLFILLDFIRNLDSGQWGLFIIKYVIVSKKGKHCAYPALTLACLRMQI